jgi:hypothetical protein
VCAIEGLWKSVKGSSHCDNLTGADRPRERKRETGRERERERDI